MTPFPFAILAALTLLAGSGAVVNAGSADIVVDDAWARATVGADRPGAAYMTLTNTGDTAVTLTGVESPVSMMPMVHKTTTDDEGLSTMGPAGDITIPAGESVALEPGGFHAMLMKLRQPLDAGNTIQVTLLFADGGEVTIPVPVLPISARGPDG